MSLRMRLILMATIPLLGVLYFAVSNFVEERALVAEAEDTQQLAEFSRYASALIHQIQRERGASDVFIGSRGKAGREALDALRFDTDVNSPMVRGRLLP